MGSWLEINPINCGQWRILLVFGFDSDLTTKGEGSSRLEDEWG